jgi:beta-mannosidase
MSLAPSPWRHRVDGHDIEPLDHDWQAAVTDGSNALTWRPARVPGTAAGVLRDAGLDSDGDLDGQEWSFRTTFEGAPATAGEEVVLRLDGVATLAEVELNGEQIADVGSMFATSEIDVGARLRGTNELVIRCLPLTSALDVPRKPRARWRTNLVADGRLRWFRTMILGRAPGFAPGPPVVGPWRPVSLVRRRDVVVEALAVRTHLDGDDGILRVEGHLRSLGGVAIGSIALELDGPSGQHAVPLETVGGDGNLTFTGELRVPSVRRWWPHTHGESALHDVRLVVGLGARTVAIDAGRVGFRTLAPGPAAAHDIERDGLDLHVNGVRIFARGALWTPTDIVGFATSQAELRPALEAVRAAGMNMLRLPGTGAYEVDAFHDLCDELGLLVWQDFMFANLDYPFADDAFRELVEAEATEVLARISGRPSTAVLCGNSEIEQQVAMLGLDPALGRDAFFGTTLPALAVAAGTDAIYVPSAPFGGDLPFRPDRGVANYYGVGGYRRPLSDARVAGVRFASECLAFANVPDDAVIESLLPGSPASVVIGHPAWKAGVPRDAGAGWDFDDVRDHYLAAIFELDPIELRRVDHARYLELSRAVTGEVMAEVFGEWRRAGSPSGGGLVLWLRDLVAGAGWGVVDHLGSPKVAYHHLRRAFAPAAVWTTDEGLGGVVVHVANDGPEPLAARLRVTLYRDLEQRVGGGESVLRVEPHGSHERNVEDLIGHFADVSWAYRFGPPAQDVIVASLERDGDPDATFLSQAFRFPAGRPDRVEAADRLGLSAEARPCGDGVVRLTVRSRRLAYGVRIHAPGFAADDDAFSVEPGGSREVDLRPRTPDLRFSGELSAINLTGRLPISMVAAS